MSLADGISATAVATDTVTVTVAEANAATSTYEYGFSADAVCDGSDTYGNAFTSGFGFSISSEAQNGNYICVVTTDIAGNTSYTASANQLAIDVTDPVIAVSDDAEVGPVSSDTIVVTVTDLNLATSTYEYGFSADAVCDGSDTYGNAFTSGVGFSLATETSNGQYLCIKAADGAGNIAYRAGSTPINIDATAPTVAISTPASNAILTSSANQTVTGTGENGATVTVTDDAGGLCTTIVAGGTWSCNVPLSATSTVSVYDVTVVDLAGNMGTSSKAVLVYLDTDGDGHPDVVETAAGTDPNIATSTPADSDGDGVSDAWETGFANPNTDPNDNLSRPVDADGDGHPDIVELGAGSDPTASTSVPTDSDGDQVPDYVEIIHGTNPLVIGSYRDSDSDLVPDYTESLDATDATSATAYGDTDGDQVPDYVESVIEATDPNNVNDFQDTDSGSVSDYVETILLPNTGNPATNQNDPNDDIAGITVAAATEDGDINGAGEPGATLTITDGGFTVCTVTVPINGQWSCTMAPALADNTIITITQVAGPSTNSATYTTSYPVVVAPSTSGGGSSAYRRYVCKDSRALNYERVGRMRNSLCEYAEDIEEEIAEEVEEVEEVATDTTRTTTETIEEGASESTTVTTTDTEESSEAQEVDESTISLGEARPQFLENVSALNQSLNDPEEVNKLIAFLNDREGESLPQDGSYDEQDIEAVKRFQEKYAQDVLNVWGLENPTGYVGITTRLKMNLLYNNVQLSCPGFNEYNRLGLNVQTEEVKRTEELLRSIGFFDGEPDIIWDIETRDAIILFQETFAETMLAPWGLTEGTGFKYKTTNKFMNGLVGCQVGEIVLENGVSVDY